MAEFTPITSQEQLDALISDRLKRDRETTAKKYADYEDLKFKTSNYESQIDTLTKSLDEANQKIASSNDTISSLNKKIADYETASVKARMAREYGIPYEMAGRLSGTTEEEIRTDAETMSQYFRSSAPPMGDTEHTAGNSEADSYVRLLRKMKGE